MIKNSFIIMKLAIFILMLVACELLPTDRQAGITQNMQSPAPDNRTENRIIYISKGKYWAMDEDSQNLRVIWNCPARGQCEKMSPNWDKGIYLEKGEEVWNIRLREKEKERGRILMSNVPHKEFYSAWSYDGQKIVALFHIPLPEERQYNELYIIDVETGKSELLDRGIAGPYWSPDSKKLLIADFNPGRYGLYVEDLERNTRTKIFDRLAENRKIWSPDSQKLVMKISLEGDIYISNLADGTLSRITDPEQYNYETATNPVWSPDGKKIAYIARYVDSREQTHFRVLFIHDVGTGNQTPLVEQVQRDEVVWSPDSQKIIYRSHEDRNYYIIDIETKQTTKILDGEVGNVIAWE